MAFDIDKSKIDYRKIVMAYKLILKSTKMKIKMKMREITSHNELLNNIKDTKKAYLLLYKKGSEQSECSLKNISSVNMTDDNIEVLAADVTSVRDIHPNYNVTTVPTLIEFEKGEFVNMVKGCHAPDFYKSYFENAVYAAKAASNDKPQKRVTVYSTPSCSWCTTLKTHLKKNGIRFSDIDVSKDQKAAQEMQRKSGQNGVPQTDISGQMIVGFDKVKINSLLGIQG
jgi:glutaredoxin-like YruB-family protein